MKEKALLEHSHDLRLPDWGPYTKKYTGISHLPEVNSGLRFDLAVFPGYYRRQVLVPNAKWESGFHPWEAAPDLSYYAYRYEIEWKDQVYCDVSFSALGPEARYAALAPLIDWMSHYGAFWRDRFDRLENLLKRMDQ